MKVRKDGDRFLQHTKWNIASLVQELDPFHLPVGRLRLSSGSRYEGLNSGGVLPDMLVGFRSDPRSESWYCCRVLFFVIACKYFTCRF